MSCDKDCIQPLVFPRKIGNRAGLPTIDYRIGRYADVRAYLFDQLNRQPALAAWTHRGVDDPGIALLEGSAIVADILTYYQSLYANEAYLGTAQWPESIADLVRLGGYRLAPGVAGEATFALTIKGSAPVSVPLAFGFKAQIEGQALPVEFETRAALLAYPQLSSFYLYRPRMTPAIATGVDTFRLAANDPEVKTGDRLLLGVPLSGAANPTRLNATEVVTVASTWEAFGERYIKLQVPAGQANPSPPTGRAVVGDCAIGRLPTR
jgi:hypothetical protein